MLNDRSKGSFTESQVFLLSDDNTTARIGRAVMESDRDVQLFIIDNRYLFDFLRETVRLPIVHDYMIRCRGVDNLIKKSEHLDEKQNTISNSRSLNKKVITVMVITKRLTILFLRFPFLVSIEKIYLLYGSFSKDWELPNLSI